MDHHEEKILVLILCLPVCLCLAPAAQADSEGSEYFAVPKQAITSGETYLDLRQCATMVISESITILSSLSVVGASSNTTVVIPRGVTLTINPDYEPDMWDTRLELNGSIVNYGRCVITRTDPTFSVVVECGETGSLNRVSISGGLAP